MAGDNQTILNAVLKLTDTVGDLKVETINVKNTLHNGLKSQNKKIEEQEEIIQEHTDLLAPLRFLRELWEKKKLVISIVGILGFTSGGVLINAFNHKFDKFRGIDELRTEVRNNTVQSKKNYEILKKLTNLHEVMGENT